MCKHENPTKYFSSVEANQVPDKTVFYQDWFDQGVYSVCDIPDSSGMYLNFADFCRKFSVKCNFLTYFQVLSAIPKRLLEKARDSFGNNIIFNLIQGIPLFTVTVDLSKLTCKNYYCLFFEQEGTLRNWQASGNMTFLSSLYCGTQF